MGQALQCPKCGAKHPLDRHAGATTFVCAKCGQLLKVPAELRTSPAPPPSSDRTMAAAGGSTRVLAEQPSPTAPDSTRTPRVRATRTKPPMVWRVLAWIVAVFAGGLIVFAGGRVFGYLSGQRALDVVLSSGIDRYTVLLPLVPIWAVISTLLVTLLLDGGAALVRRRRSRAMPADDPPSPRRPSEGRRIGRPQGPPGTSTAERTG